VNDPPTAPPTALPTALLAEAASKSGLVWLRPIGAGRTWAVWHVWLDDAFVVVGGPGEQQLPPLEVDVEVLVRSKDSGARLLTVTARPQVLDPADPAWPAATRALAAGRLNSDRSPAELPDRWRSRGVRIFRLVPVSAAEWPGHYGDASGAAPPSPSPATTSGRRPWHLRGRRRRWLRR
jgi:hypothetical protein